MAEETKKKGKLSWHPAFYASIQIEFEEEADKLTFENEHQLGTDPMSIDVLIIKKHTEEEIRKNIGRIFRDYNILEYKSPEDYLSIDAFYKVLGYACFYKSDVQYVDTIKVEEITISYVSKKYPRKLIQHLKKVRGYQLVPQGDGIWYIEGGMFPMQLIVTSKLSPEDNFWLRNLTNDLKEREEAEKLFTEYGKHKNSNLHKSVMDLIMKANQKEFKEARGSMCDALIELMEDVIQEKVEEKVEQKVEEEKKKAISEGFSQGISIGEVRGAEEKLLEQVGKKLAKGKSVEQIADELEESVDTIERLMKKLEEKQK